MGLLAASLARAAKRAPRPSAESVPVPAPTGSINTVSSGFAMPPDDCLVRYNLIPAEYGLRSRLGSREWVSNLDGEVRALLPFTAATSAGNKLFATTQTGIWDVTTSTDSPTQVVTFGSQDANSGHGSSTVMVTAAGHFLIYCDESNGAYTYTASTDTWAASNVTGVTVGDLVHVCAWKNRLWFTERATGSAWYLATNAISGSATEFNFGARFKAGGDLRGLWSWTGDGGSGIDDHLVAVSGGGDVLVYQGTDPATSGAFGLRGVYSLGGVPAGRRICSDFGGDLLMMSTTGLLPASMLVDGQIDAGQYATLKIRNKWNKLMLTRSAYLGWQMVIHPLDNTLIVVVPTGTGLNSEQLAMSLTNRGWSEYRDLQMGIAACAYGGNLYYGNKDGSIRIMDGDTDGRTLAAPSTTTPITWSLLTGFSNLGTPRKKRVHLIEPVFSSDTSAPTYATQARFDFDMQEATDPAIAPTAAATNTWDTGVWDTAVWGGDYMATLDTRGITGMGRFVALALKGSSVCRTVLQGLTVTYDEGGLL